MRFDLPADKVLVHTMSIPIRWGDMDAMAHVNNTVYFRYFETVRLDWLSLNGARVDPQGEGPVIVNAFCTYLQQVTFPGTLIARHFIANPGRTSIETYLTLEREDQPGVPCTTGGARMVWFDARLQRAAPLPAWLRDAVAG